MKRIVFASFVLVSVLGIFSLGFAFAQDYNIGKLCYVQDNHINPCNGWTSVAGNHGGWITWDTSRENSEWMFKSAMAALLAGKDVIVRIDHGDSSAYYDKTTIIRVKR